MCMQHTPVVVRLCIFHTMPFCFVSSDGKGLIMCITRVLTVLMAQRLNQHVQKSCFMSGAEESFLPTTASHDYIKMSLKIHHCKIRALNC